MQPTIEITPDTIEQLRPQLLGRHCAVESFGGRGADQAYLLRIGGQHYRITRNTFRTLLKENTLPPTIAIPIIDYAFENNIFRRKETDSDGEMIFWI